jgi:hypothetical protein
MAVLLEMLSLNGLYDDGSFESLGFFEDVEGGRTPAFLLKVHYASSMCLAL